MDIKITFTLILCNSFNYSLIDIKFGTKIHLLILHNIHTYVTKILRSVAQYYSKESTGVDWISYKCSRWLYEGCIEDVVKGSTGDEHFCSFCFENYTI